MACPPTIPSAPAALARIRTSPFRRSSPRPSAAAAHLAGELGADSPAVAQIKGIADQALQGGGPLLGVNGIVIIGHGRSDAEAVANAISTAAMASQQSLLEALASLAPDQGGA